MILPHVIITGCQAVAMFCVIQSNREYKIQRAKGSGAQNLADMASFASIMWWTVFWLLMGLQFGLAIMSFDAGIRFLVSASPWAGWVVAAIPSAYVAMIGVRHVWRGMRDCTNLDDGHEAAYGSDEQ